MESYQDGANREAAKMEAQNDGSGGAEGYSEFIYIIDE